MLLSPSSSRVPLLAQSLKPFASSLRPLHSSFGLNSKRPDYYMDLGLDWKASQEEIKLAFYKLSKEYHPDRRPDDPAAKQKFQSVVEAHQILSNVRLRREYDQGRNVDSAMNIEDLEHTYEGEERELRSRRVQRDLQGGARSSLDFYIKSKTTKEFERKQFHKHNFTTGRSGGSGAEAKRSAASGSGGGGNMGPITLFMLLFIAVSILRHRAS